MKKQKIKNKFNNPNQKMSLNLINKKFNNQMLLNRINV